MSNPYEPLPQNPRDQEIMRNTFVPRAQERMKPVPMPSVNPEQPQTLPSAEAPTSQDSSLSKPSPEPTSLEFVAMNIVHQIGDVLVPLGAEGVKLRQRTNDELIDFTSKLISQEVSKGIREFAERLKKGHPIIGGGHSGCEICPFIDQALNELEEE